MPRIAAPVASPIYSGLGTSVLVPGKWDCALNGHVFMIDWEKTYTGVGRVSRQSLSLLKPQQDTSGNVSEASLNPEEFARRAAESWHHGAGQTHLDRPDSDAARFRTSKGVNVWTKWALSLLNDTTNRRASSATNLQLVSVGSYLYAVDGNDVYWTQDITVAPSWTAAVIQAGEAAQSVKSITSDGYTVYAALGSNGIHTTTRGAASSSHYNALAATLVGYVKGRLMAAQGASIFNVTASGAAPSALLTQPNSDFTWVGFAEGSAAIYAAGYSGDKSLIYRTAVKADGTALDVPVVAGELPDGEIVRSIQGYLGQYVVLGTDKGVRFCTTDASGNLVIGALIPTGAAVSCFEPQDRFVWYGLTNYDGSSTGLGRMDLSAFVDTLTPAYATDLMAAGQGAVLSVATFQNLRIFAVSGAGVFAESSSKVASGSIDSGLIAYGLPDTKVSMYIDVRFGPLVGTVAVALSADGGGFVTLNTATVLGAASMVNSAGEYRAETFEVRLTLTGSGASSPTVTRWTLESNPAPGRGEYWDLPLLLYETVTCANDDEEPVDVASEYAALVSMEALGAPIIHQDGMGTTVVFLDDHEFLVNRYTRQRDAFNGTFVARLHRPRQRS